MSLIDYTNRYAYDNLYRLDSASGSGISGVYHYNLKMSYSNSGIFKIRKIVVLFSLLFFICVNERTYCQIKKIDDILIYLDNEAIDKTDKKLKIKINPVKKDFFEIKGYYAYTRFYSQVRSGMFEEIDSISITAKSKKQSTEKGNRKKGGKEKRILSFLKFFDFLYG